MRLTSLLVASLATIPAAATAQEASGSIGELMVECRGMVESVEAATSPRDKVGAGVCSGYLYGVADMSRVVLTRDGHRALSNICIPEGVSIAQLGRVFVKWAEEHPETQHVHRTFGVLNSFSAAFPCPKE